MHSPTSHAQVCYYSAITYTKYYDLYDTRCMGLWTKVSLAQLPALLARARGSQHV